MSGIGAAIRRERQRRGWTQDQLAKAAKVDLRTVGRIERGEVKDPSKAGALQEALKMGIFAEPTSDRRDPRLSEATFPELLGALAVRHGQDIRDATAAVTAAVAGIPFTVADELPPETLERLQKGRLSAGAGDPTNPTNHSVG